MHDEPSKHKRGILWIADIAWIVFVVIGVPALVLDHLWLIIAAIFFGFVAAATTLYERRCRQMSIGSDGAMRRDEPNKYKWSLLWNMTWVMFIILGVSAFELENLWLAVAAIVVAFVAVSGTLHERRHAH